MTYEPQNIEAVRAYWASYQKLEQEGLVVGTALEDNREALALGQAWARCEAARPPSSMVTLQGYPQWHAPDYSAAIVILARLGGEAHGERCSGPTPTAALEALAEKLESLRP